MNSEQFLANQVANLKNSVQIKIDEILPDFEEFHSNTDLAKIEVLSWVLEKVDKISFRYSRRLEESK